MNDETRRKWEEIAAIVSPAKPKPQHPDAPGCEGLSEKARDTASTLYGSGLLKKDAGLLSPSELDFLRQGIAAWRADNE